MEQQTETPRRRWAVRISRDTVLFVLGLAGIGYQQVTGKVLEPLLIVYGIMVGLPGAAALLELMPARRGRTDTGTSSSPSPSPSSPPSSSPT